MNKLLNGNLRTTDPTMHKFIQEEHQRQKEGLELIASENFTSKPVMECLGSVLTNKYSEGLPSARYYGGNEVIDKIENLCRTRALSTYRLNPEKWGINVQPYSGSSANMAVYTGLLNPHDRIMGLDLPSGGHLTHGFYTAKKKVSATSIFFESLPYHIKEDGYIDYDELEKMTKIFKPKLIVCGYSAYPRDLDYEKFRSIANINNSILMCDMAHYSGLVATQELKNPFDYCDIVTTTTHKTLRGPRAGMIFYKKEYEKNIDSAVFPGLQGGPHEHQIAAIATQLLQVQTPEFKEYIVQLKKNAVSLGDRLMEYGYNISTNGTDNHLLLVNLRSHGVTGSKVEKICELVNISINKNSVYGDTSALSPGGIRLGTSPLTSRNFLEEDFEKVALFLHQCIQLAKHVQEKSGKKMKDFNLKVEEDEEIQLLLKKIKTDVNEFALEFPLYD
tara:strand:+ start:1438 stop:2775 length:1338 start_codon:yes stop_codon:yes gene_type:complete